MQISHPTTLTSDDHGMLERLMCTLSGSRTPLASLLRRKLETAVILHPAADRGDLVTSKSKVRYIVDGEHEAEHTLSWGTPPPAKGPSVSLQQERGLALLGMRVGQSISFPVGEEIETVEVIGVYPTPKLADHTDNPSRDATSKRVSTILSTIKRHAGAALARLQIGRTEAALRRLSDAALRDIGITRGEIPHIAQIVAGVTPTPAEHRDGTRGIREESLAQETTAQRRPKARRESQADRLVHDRRSHRA